MTEPWVVTPWSRSEWDQLGDDPNRAAVVDRAARFGVSLTAAARVFEEFGRAVSLCGCHFAELERQAVRSRARVHRMHTMYGRRHRRG